MKTTYIVKVYRQDLRKNPRKIVGVVEEVGVKGKKGFTNLEELWEILTPAESTPRKSKKTGNHVSDKYGIEKRSEVRIKKDLPFAFTHNERNFEARMLNYSRNGLGVKISDSIPLAVGETVEINVRDSDAKARVAWVNTESDPSITMAGFRIVEGGLKLN